METYSAKVLFRTWSRQPHRGTVDAIFPEVATDLTGQQVLTYAHVGQHGSGDRHYYLRQTRPATPEEYAPLKEELERIGYDLTVVDRITPAMDRVRIAAARAL